MEEFRIIKLLQKLSKSREFRSFIQDTQHKVVIMFLTLHANFEKYHNNYMMVDGRIYFSDLVMI